MKGQGSLLLAALLLPGCGATAEPGAGSPAELPAPAPLAPSLGALPAPPPGTGDGFRSDFRRAFTHGLIIERDGERVEIAVLHLGLLQVRQGGALSAGDPLGAEPPLPLPLRVPAAAYPVELSHARFVDAQGRAEERIAAARLRLDAAPPVAWRWAGQYPLSSGIGAFLGPGAGDVLPERGARLHAAILEAVERDPAGGGLLAVAAEADLAFFPAGEGEGSVELYVGVDKDGHPVELIADFQVLVEPDEVEARVKDPAAWPPGILPAPVLEELGIELRRAHEGETIPTTGAPCWIAIDARSINRDARFGFPRVRAWDAEGRELELKTVTEGYRLWLPPPATPPAALAVVLQVGLKPL